MDGQKPPFLKICDFGFARHFDQKHGLGRSVSHIGCALPCACTCLQRAGEPLAPTSLNGCLQHWADGCGPATMPL